MAFSLDTGLAADDYVHIWLLDGAPGMPGFEREPWDIFRFTTPDTTISLRAQGILSWWADPEAKLAFLRPLSSLTHYLDHLLWPTAGWAMHLHSLLWGVLALGGVLALYRSILGNGALLGLAFFLYALDDARCWFVSWVAGRNTVIAAALSFWVLVLHVRGRQTGGKQGLWALPLFAISLLAGEGAVSGCAFLFAYAVFLEQDRPLPQRLLRLWPYAAIVVLWRAGYTLAGYGAARSGLYADPGGDTFGFLRAFVERGPVLLFSQLGGPWSDVYLSMFMYPTGRMVFVVAACLAIALATWLLWPQARRDPITAFGLAGGLLCLVPATAAFPADRLLNWVSLGAAPVMARFMLDHLGASDSIGWRRKVGTLLAPLLVFIHLVLAPPVLAHRARGNITMRDMLDRVDASVPKTANIGRKEIVYINPPAVPLAAYLPIMRGVKGEPRPKRQLWLSSALGPVTVTRLTQDTLRVSTPISIYENEASQLLRSPLHPFVIGQQIDVGAHRFTVRELDERGGPRTFDVRFGEDPEGPGLVFLAWVGNGFRPFPLPEIGQRTSLPAADYFEVIFGEPGAIDGRHPNAR